MKIKIEIDDSISEDEVLIKCRELNESISKLQHLIIQSSNKVNFTFYKGNVEHYLSLNKILFFETSQNTIEAHTRDDVFQIKSRLYELEEILPNSFIRISKSTIVNVDHIYSIDRTLASSGTIKFNNTHKQVYVSRNYNKILKTRLEERRNYYE